MIGNMFFRFEGLNQIPLFNNLLNAFLYRNLFFYESFFVYSMWDMILFRSKVNLCVDIRTKLNNTINRNVVIQEGGRAVKKHVE